MGTKMMWCLKRESYPYDIRAFQESQHAARGERTASRRALDRPVTPPSPAQLLDGIWISMERRFGDADGVAGIGCSSR